MIDSNLSDSSVFAQSGKALHLLGVPFISVPVNVPVLIACKLNVEQRSKVIAIVVATTIYLLR